MFWNSTRGGQSAVLRHDGASLKGPAERSGRSHSTVGDDATAGFSSRAEGVALAWAGVLHNEQGQETVLDQNRERRGLETMGNRHVC